MGILTKIVEIKFKNHKIFLHCHHIEQLLTYNKLENRSLDAVKNSTKRISDDDRDIIEDRFTKALEKSNRAMCLHYYRLLSELESSIYQNIKEDLCCELEKLAIPVICKIK